LRMQRAARWARLSPRRMRLSARSSRWRSQRMTDASATGSSWVQSERSRWMAWVRSRTKRRRCSSSIPSTRTSSARRPGPQVQRSDGQVLGAEHPAATRPGECRPRDERGTFAGVERGGRRVTIANGTSNRELP
jgi:hypothetical protein